MTGCVASRYARSSCRTPNTREANDSFQSVILPDEVVSELRATSASTGSPGWRIYLAIASASAMTAPLDAKTRVTDDLPLPLPHWPVF